MKALEPFDLQDHPAGNYQQGSSLKGISFTMRKSFIIHIDSLAILNDLSDEECGQLFKAINAYQSGEEIELSPIVRIAFSPFKNQFGRDAEKYEKLCEKNRLIAVNRHKNNPTKSTTGNQPSPTVTKSTDNDSKSKSKSKSDKDKRLDQSALDRPSVLSRFVETENCFDLFWESGIRKVNKKKAKSLFNNLLKKQDDIGVFTSKLCRDVSARLNSNQLGFAEMHPTTYLNGERWKDEVINHAENRSNGYSSTNKLTPTERVQAKRAEAARRRGTVEPMGNYDQVISPCMDEQGRGGTDRPLGETINGTFSRSD